MALPGSFHELWSDELVGELAQMCRTISAGPGELEALVPDTEQIRDMLGACFAASLERDEGRETKFSLLFRPAELSGADYCFEKPLPLEAGGIRRLAAGLNLRRGYILVAPSQGALAMIGVTIVPGQRGIVQGHGGAQGFAVQVFGAGLLVVQYMSARIAAHRRGRTICYRAPIPQLASLYAVTQLPLTPGSVTPRQAGGYLAEAMVRLGHGGTLLVLAKAEAEWRKRLNCTTRFEAAPPCRAVTEAAHAAERENSALQSLHTKFPDFGAEFGDAAGPLGNLVVRGSFDLQPHLDWLAQLTAADGMTVIDGDLTLLAFAVMVQPPVGESAEFGIEIRDPFEPQPTRALLAELGGGRHQSAARACSEFRDAVAFVASQDGELTSMRWDATADVLVVSKHLELSL